MMQKTSIKKDKKQVNHGDSTLTAATEATEASASCVSYSASTSTKRHSLLEIPFTILLPLLVLIDMIGVSLVVPLLHSQYFQLAGVNSAVQREWLSSVFSASQIVGGLVIGALSDSQVISRHVILMMSFTGSAFAYAMIMQGGLVAILISRVTVGLVKQTMTVTSSMMAHATHQKERATHVGRYVLHLQLFLCSFVFFLGFPLFISYNAFVISWCPTCHGCRLNASVTVAWIVGPSAGAYLFSHVGTYAPIYVSLVLFSLNTLLVLFCLPKEEEKDIACGDAKDKMESDTKQNGASGLKRILSNFHACFHSDNPCLTSAVVALLLFQWTLRTTSYKNIATFYETRFGSEPYQRGYLQSYQSALTFVVQSSLVRPILKYAGGEVNAACGAAMLMAMADFVTVKVDFLQYLVLLCPLNAIATAILGITLKSVVSKVAPKQSLGSVFATIDILQNTAQVTVPFYRTMLFSMTQPADNLTLADQNGDPDPNQWLISSGVHWLIATAAFSYILLQGSPCANMDDIDIDQDGTNVSSASSRKLKAS